MKHLSAFLARCLLVVLLATVLAPGFAWQMLGGMDQAMLEEKEAASGHHHAAYADHDSDGMLHLVHGDETRLGTDCGACDGLASEDCDDLQHHCCPGHVLGHLSASFLANGQVVFPALVQLAVDRENRRFSTRIPEGIERPPRSFSA